MKKRIEMEIERLEEMYYYYLEKLEDRSLQYKYSIFTTRIHDIRIEINTLKRVLEMI